MRIAFNAILDTKQTIETIGRAVGDGTRCRGHREIRPGGRRANLLVHMPFPRPIAAPDGPPDGNQGTDHGRRADGQGEEGGGDRRDGGLPRGFSRGTLRTEQGTAKNDAGGYQSRDLHPQRASRHVTHDACPQPDAPERALAPSIASAMRPSACNACKALDEDVASLRGCEGAARRP